MGRADARVQRGPGVLLDHRARDVRRAPADDLRLLRHVRWPRARPPAPACVERIALGGTSQGGVFEARRSTQARPPATSDAASRPSSGATSSGRLLKIGDRGAQSARRSASIARRCSRSPTACRAASWRGCARRSATTWTARFKDAEGLPLDLIASRLPEEEAFYREDAGARLVDDADDVLERGHHAGQDADERPRLVVAPARQRPRARHLVPPERRRAAQGRDRASSSATIRSSSAATCCTATSASPSRGSTPTRSTSPTCCVPGETDAPAGLQRALANANALQDIVMDEIRPGRTGNEILAAVARADEGDRDRRHGLLASDRRCNGHGAGPLIGLWDYQDGVPGRGDAKVIPSMWFSIELQATTPVPGVGQPAGAHGAGRRRHRRRRRQDPLGAQAAGQAVPCSLVTARVAAAAAKLGDLLCFLAVLAAVLAELAFFRDGAITGGVRTLRWSHDDLQRAF